MSNQDYDNLLKKIPPDSRLFFDALSRTERKAQNILGSTIFTVDISGISTCSIIFFPDNKSGYEKHCFYKDTRKVFITRGGSCVSSYLASDQTRKKIAYRCAEISNSDGSAVQEYYIFDPSLSPQELSYVEVRPDPANKGKTIEKAATFRRSL